MPTSRLAHSLMLKGLKLNNCGLKRSKNVWRIWAQKISTSEVCPKCATLCTKLYDHREVRVKDAPIRDVPTILIIRKRRFFCKKCAKPFTEPVHGIGKRNRSTERFRRYIFDCCERYGDLKTVRKVAKCSASYLYKNFYRLLDRKCALNKMHWPTTIGIDEHFFKHNKVYGHREFVTVLVNLNKHRLIEVVEGRASSILEASLANISGREGVKNVVMDLSTTYRSFAKQFFPNAKLVADKFHVLRLLNPSINKYRKSILNTDKKNPVRYLLLKSAVNVDYFRRTALNKWLEGHKPLQEIYNYKESLFRLYRTKGFSKARKALISMLDQMSETTVPEIKTLRKTLLSWKNEILAYFETRLTNATTEGYNNKAKVIKRKAYGYRSFKNYRARLLAACS